MKPRTCQHISGRCARLLAAAALLAGCSGAAVARPIVITHGGTYAGEWSSDDPDVAVVKIQTREPVIIENARLRGRGTLIDANAGAVNLVVRNTLAIGENPNRLGRSAGRFIDADEIAALLVEHCELDGTAGIYLHLMAPDAPGTRSLRIIANIAKNIDGRKSDEKGGYLDFNRRVRLSDGHVEEGCDLVQFVQLNGVKVAGGEIAWNQITNEPGRSRVEDNINIYESGGTADRPLLMHDNCIDGAYTIDPARSSEKDDGWQNDWEFSGGGILLGDGPGATPESASSCIRAERNVVVATGNYGIGVAAGHDIYIGSNVVLASGVLSGGGRVAAQNVGVYVWDMAKGKQKKPSSFFNIAAEWNTIGWAGKAPGSRNDFWTPDISTWEHNQAWPVPVLPVDERKAVAAWLTRAAAADQSPGPSTSARPVPAKR